MSSTRCILPWIHLHTTPDGKCYPCCISNKSKPLTTAKTLEQSWNSSRMIAIRDGMLNDKKPSECAICYSQEAAGAMSKRQQSNIRFAKHFSSPEISSSVLNDFSLKFLDLRFSNVCNQKCRTCGPVFSTGWYGDHEKLTGEKGSALVKISSRATSLDEFMHHAPHLEAINFAGGEPLLMKEHYDALQHLIDVGNTDVSLTYNTNLSVLDFADCDVLSLWKHFKNVTVGVSIDDVEERAEYIRAGAKWSTIESNIKRAKSECPHIRFYAAMTVSVYNVFHIREAHEYLVRNGLFDAHEFFLSAVHEPFYLSVSALPDDLREEAKRYVESFLSEAVGKTQLVSGLRKVIERLNNPNGEVEQLISFTKRLDAIRGEDVSVTIPELSSLFVTN